MVVEKFQEAFKHRKGRGDVADDDSDGFSHEVKEDLRDLGISESVIRDGGDYRQFDPFNPDGTRRYQKARIYWLPLDLLADFEHHDQEISDDQEFFDWFESFLDEKKPQTKADHKQEKKGRSWTDWKPSWEYESKERRIGSWWSNWGYSSTGGSGSELTKRLAIALKAINTTVSVVNTTGNRYRVRLAANEEFSAPSSFTNYDERLIQVSPQALLDTSIEQDDGIEITTAFGLHEASHVEYSESERVHLTEPSKLRPMSIAHLFHNLLEDMRIEHLTSEKFPGFADYFPRGNQFLWDRTGTGTKTEWGEALETKVSAIIRMTKFQEWSQPEIDLDPVLGEHAAWWQPWAENYRDGHKGMRESLIAGLQRLAEDEDTKQQMDELTQKEEDAEKQAGMNRKLTDEEFEELMKLLKQQLDPNGQIGDPCPSPNQPGATVELTEEQAEELNHLLDEQYQQVEAFYKMTEGNTTVAPVIEVSRPVETDESRDQYDRPGPLVDRMKEVFFFRKKITAETERLLQTGLVDEEELWRVGVGDTRVFERTTVPEEARAAVTLLTDVSGSMWGSGLDKAAELASVMLQVLRLQRGVTARVRAHTTGAIDNGETSAIYRIWEPGDPETRLGTLHTVESGANFDGFAIDWCAKELYESADDDVEKLLIVLSDGLPNGSWYENGKYLHYGGASAMDHMRQLTDYWIRQGVNVIQIAIDSDLRPADQNRMFANWVGYENDTKLLFDLTRILIKTFGGIE
jgi:hypothetical protein